MKITCPNCHSEYSVNKKELSSDGRKTKCFVCDSIWTQYESGKTEQIREMRDFIDEIKIRQDSIKDSLRNNIYEKKSLEKENTKPLTRDEEREFLAALAIEEIQGHHQWTESVNPLNSKARKQDIGPDKVTENFSHSTKGQGEDGRKTKKINRTFLGFTIVSIICIVGLILFTNRNIITQLDVKYQKPLLDFLQITDLLIAQIKNHILALKDSIYIYFFNKD
ncbi:MAG: zinc-ribbon domain-containing protein [Paracoccaceae bacterium]|nr:zinc-ribbon domain-containing protein [Paracoccaceae bacterium]